MGYLVAVILIALGVLTGYEGLERSLGEALCDSGDCPGPSSGPGLLLALTLASFVGAGIAGSYAWKKENRALEPEDRDGVGPTLLLAAGVVLLGLLLGVGATVLVNPN